MNRISHFAVNADDIDRAKQFYEAVLGWSITPWGPPGFFQIDTGEGGLRGALQQRREIRPGKPMFGFECTVAVSDIAKLEAEVVANGGRIVMEKATIAGVGHLVFFEDPEGNIVGAMEYEGSTA
ncbi:MAG: VOC family protein [Myxococcota bacterium]